MSRSRPVILVTGFGPFPGAPQNASSVLANDLVEAASPWLPGYAIRAEILPTEWQAAPARLDRLLSEWKPAVAVHFGVSHRARGFVVEMRAKNVCQETVDACGAYPAGPCIANEGPVELASTLPTNLIAERLRQRRLPVELSRDAGGYLCNAILYHSLSQARRNEGAARPPRRGFIHIPDRLIADRRGGARLAMRPRLDWDEAVAGGIEILAACAGVSPA